MDRETVAADSGYLRIEQFLPADAHQRVLDVALACESQFTDSQVYDDDAPDRWGTGPSCSSPFVPPSTVIVL